MVPEARHSAKRVRQACGPDSRLEDAAPVPEVLCQDGHVDIRGGVRSAKRAKRKHGGATSSSTSVAPPQLQPQPFSFWPLAAVSAPLAIDAPLSIPGKECGAAAAVEGDDALSELSLMDLVADREGGSGVCGCNADVDDEGALPGSPSGSASSSGTHEHDGDNCGKLADAGTAKAADEFSFWAEAVSKGESTAMWVLACAAEAADAPEDDLCNEDWA